MTDVFADGGMRMRAAALRAEWRGEEEVWTRAALEHWEHGRTLGDAALDCMHRGDVVAITAVGVVLTGVVVAVGIDTVRLVDDEGHVDLSLDGGAPLVMRVITRAPAGGVSGVAGTYTFRTRLLEHESCTAVELAASTLDGAVVGALRVGADHARVRTRDDIDTFVPLRSVAWVRDRSELVSRAFLSG